MDPSNNSLPFRHLPQLRTGLPSNVNEQNVYGPMHVQPPVFQPPPLPIPPREFAGMSMSAYNRAMLEVMRSQMQFFWSHQMLELNNIGALRQQLLPLARIKRVMKSNPRVKMISADTPVLFSKACELFIMELSFRAWLYAESSDRRTMERCDVLNAVAHANIFRFLLRIIQ